MEKNQDIICCPPFDAAPWDGKMHEWTDKKFIKDAVSTLFYMPLNFGAVMRRTDRQIRAAGGTVPDNMGLSDHTSKWNMDVYIAVDKEIPGVKNVKLSGTFASKVYEGPYKDTAIWHKDFGQWCTKMGYRPVKYYMWYTTCPKCAKKYGKNYVVIVAEIEKP